jgi:hypothetical protein
VGEVALGSTIGGLAMDACFDQLFVSLTGGLRIDVFDPDTLLRTSSLRLGVPVYALTPGAAGHLLVVTDRGLFDLDLGKLKFTLVRADVDVRALACTDRDAVRAWIAESKDGEIAVTCFELGNLSAAPLSTAPGALPGNAIGLAVSFAGDRLFVGTDGPAGVVVLDSLGLASVGTVDAGPGLAGIAVNSTSTRLYYSRGGALVQSVNLDVWRAPGADVFPAADVGERGLHVAPNNLGLVVHGEDGSIADYELFDLRIDAPSAVRQGRAYTLELEGTPGSPWYCFMSLAPGYIYVDPPTQPDPRFFDLSLADGFVLIGFGALDVAGLASITATVPTDYSDPADVVIQAAELPMHGRAAIGVSNPLAVRFLPPECN